MIHIDLIILQLKSVQTRDALDTLSSIIKSIHQKFVLPPIKSLSKVNLFGANLSNADLSKVNLFGVT